MSEIPDITNLHMFVSASCDGPAQQMITASDSPSTQSADVVFVVEEKECNRPIIDKLGNIAMTIKKELRTRGEYS